MNAIEKAVEESITRLEELLIKSEARLAWNERDLQFLLGGILQDNLKKAVDPEILMHYDIPLSLAEYWWGGSWAKSIRPALRAAPAGCGRASGRCPPRRRSVGVDAA